MKRNGNERNATRKKQDLTPARARREKERGLIVSLYLQGNSMRRVVELAEQQTGGHRFAISTVHKYINEAVEEWKANKDDLVQNHKVIELEKINRLESTYWTGWLGSLGVMKTKKTRSAPGEGRAKLKTTEVINEDRDTAGDVRFLNGVQWCVEQRCKILGIEAPIKIENNTTLNAKIDNTTTYIRKVVFKTRETTSAPQTFLNPVDN